MPNRSVRQPTSRVYRHTVKRQLEASLTLPQIQKHGFTHPRDGYFLMLSREFAVVLALETQAVALVVLAVLRRTLGVPGDGPHGRQEWVQLSTHAMADAALMAHGAARRGIADAVRKGYLLRRRTGRTWEYAIRWRGIQGFDHRVGHFWPRSMLAQHFPLSFSLLARFSHDFNIIRTFVTDGEGMPGVEFVLMHAWSCGTESLTGENMAAASSNAPFFRC